MMRTLGIGLAAQDKKTAICAIQWLSKRAFVELPMVGVNGDAVLGAMRGADWVG